MEAVINQSRRNSIRRNHTATHLLHQALKDILGDHVQQAGSLVEEEYLRFDLTHYEQISNSQIDKLEKCVNAVILKNIDVETTLKKFDDAGNLLIISNWDMSWYDFNPFFYIF